MGAGFSGRSRSSGPVGEVEVQVPAPQGPRAPPPRVKPAPLPMPSETLPAEPPVLFCWSACPNSVRVELCVRHRGIRFERRETEPPELHTPWNVVTSERPVPRLEHGPRVIVEDVSEIVDYIDKLPGRASVLPHDLDTRARARVFIVSAVGRLTALTEAAVGMAGRERQPGAVAALAATAGRDLAALEGLADRVGSPLFGFLWTAADYALLGLVWALRAALRAGPDLPLDLPPRLAAWLPAAEAAAAALGVTEPPPETLTRLTVARLGRPLPLPAPLPPAPLPPAAPTFGGVSSPHRSKPPSDGAQSAARS